MPKEKIDNEFLNKLMHQGLRQHCIASCNKVTRYVADAAPLNIVVASDAYNITGDASYIVDIVNYSMIRQMYYPKERDKMLSIALEYDSIYNEGDYRSSKIELGVIYKMLNHDNQVPHDIDY